MTRPRRPSRPARLLVSALAAGALLTPAACSDGGDRETGSSDVAASPAAEGSRPASPLAATSPSTALTASGARSALITEADIEEDWTQVADKEAAGWHDSMLIGDVDADDFLTGKSDAKDCRRLIDGLYSEDLLGKPSGASALRGFEQDQSRLLYQVAAYERNDLEDSLAWLKSLPDKCDQFTVTDGGDQRTVQVVEISLPKVGDDRQGLHVTVKGTADGAQATLTQDVAAVLVGTDAITVTAGGLDGGEKDSVEEAVKQGTPRLKDVQAGKTPKPNPSRLD